jgi:hypothetical protein
MYHSCITSTFSDSAFFPELYLRVSHDSLKYVTIIFLSGINKPIFIISCELFSLRYVLKPYILFRRGVNNG